MRERDANWVVMPHEELVARPREVIADLYDRVGLAPIPPVKHAARLPEMRRRDYSFIKYQMMGHPYRPEINALLVERARAMGYDPNLRALRGSGFRYAVQTLISQWRSPA